MDKQKKEAYTEAIVSGFIPQQDSYTPEEVFELVNLVAVWASTQIDHAKGEMMVDDPEDYGYQLEYKTVGEAVEGCNEVIEDVMDRTSAFVREYFAGILK